MTYYIFQTLFLLVLAYFLGAWIGCLLRSVVSYRAYYGPTTSFAGHGDSAAVQASPQAENLVAASPELRPPPQETAAAPQEVRKADEPANVQVAEEDTARAAEPEVPRDNVEEGLDEAKRQTIEAAALAAAKAAAAAEEDTARAAEPEVPSDDVEEGLDEEKRQAIEAAALAAAKSAAAAITYQDADEEPIGAAESEPIPESDEREDPPAAEQDAPQPVEDESGADEKSDERSDAQETASPDDGEADNLLRIKGIDEDLAARLADSDVTRYAQISNWSPGDVARFSDQLGVPERIARENWIEQAKILAAGETTVFAHSFDKGLLPEIVGEAGTIESQPDDAPAEVSPAEVSPAEASPAEDGPAENAQIDAQAEPDESAAPEPLETEEVSSASEQAAAPAREPEPAVETLSAPDAAAELEDPISAAEISVDKAPEVESSEDIESAAPPPAATAPDDFLAIKGIDAEVAAKLSGMGIQSFQQIADWTAEDVQRASAELGAYGVIERQNWIEQASLLASGKTTHYISGPRESEAVVDPRETAEQAESSDENDDVEPVRANDLGAAAVVSERSPLISTAVKGRFVGGQMPELADIGSVDESEPAVRRDPKPDRPRRRKKAVRSRQANLDDLKKLAGVGGVLENKLNAIGVTRYDQIAGWTEKDINKFSKKLAATYRDDLKKWIDQAKILVKDGDEEPDQ